MLNNSHYKTHILTVSIRLCSLLFLHIYFLNSKDAIIIELIDKYPKSDKELVLWANSVIAEFPFDCNDEIYLDPFKDWYYKELTE